MGYGVWAMGYKIWGIGYRYGDHEVYKMRHGIWGILDYETLDYGI